MNKIIFFFKMNYQNILLMFKLFSDSNNFEICIFGWPINIEAPFEFNISKINHLNVNLIFEKSKVKPDMIFCQMA